MPRVKINIQPGLAGSVVELDGVDIAREVAAIQIGVIAGKPLADVTFHVRSEALEFDDDADVTVIRQGGSPYGPMLDLLNGVDPGELEQEALARLGLEGTEDNPTAAVLAVLKDWIQKEIDG